LATGDAAVPALGKQGKLMAAVVLFWWHAGQQGSDAWPWAHRRKATAAGTTHGTETRGGAGCRRCDVAEGRPASCVGTRGRRLCDRDAGARAQRERDVAGAEDFISRGEAALWRTAQGQGRRTEAG
jgi:hypothetical protein